MPDTKTTQAPSKNQLCSVGKETNGHDDGCSNLKKLLQDYIPVKLNHYPVMPFPFQVKQQAIDKSKKLELKDRKIRSVLYCKYHYKQFVLLNVEYNEKT